MGEVDLRQSFQKVDQNKFQGDIERVKVLGTIQDQIVEVASLFRYRWLLPQIIWRTQKPETPFPPELFENTMSSMRQWYQVLSSEQWAFTFPSWEELVERTKTAGIATSLSDVQWFMTARSEPIKV
jgi:hypothetical protein